VAICSHCNGEMTGHISCLQDPIDVGYGLCEPIRWGEEGGTKGRVDVPCRDCGTPPGGVHHPGCCVERCPVCRGQAFGCPCFDPDAWESDNGPGDDEDSGRTCRRARRQFRCRVHVLRRHFWT
jgi:hypothetical protein